MKNLKNMTCEHRVFEIMETPIFEKYGRESSVFFLENGRFFGKIRA